MRRFFLLMLMLNFLCAHSQQSIVYYSIPEERNVTAVLFDRKEINPAQFDDTALVSADVLREEQWVGEKGAFEGWVVSAEVNPGRSKSSFAAKAEFFGFKEGISTNQSYTLFYKYRIFQGDQFRVFAGAGLGFMRVNYNIHFGYDAPLEGSEAAFNSVTSGIGVFAAYRNHRLGLSYNDFLLDTEFTDGDGNEMKNLLGNFTVNYAYSVEISRSVALTPELLYFHTSNDDLIMLNALVQFNSAIRTGLFVQSDKEFGGVFSFTIARVAELGYAFTFKSMDDSDQFTGTHVIKLGFNIPNR